MKLRTVSRLVSCGNTDWFLNGFGHQTEFPFFESKTGLDKGRYRGSAAVMRIYGDMGKLDLRELGSIHWGDAKGLLLIGFSNVCAFKAADRANFVIICDRKGCYQ